MASRKKTIALRQAECAPKTRNGKIASIGPNRSKPKERSERGGATLGGELRVLDHTSPLPTGPASSLMATFPLPMQPESVLFSFPCLTSVYLAL